MPALSGWRAGGGLGAQVFREEVVHTCRTSSKQMSMSSPWSVWRRSPPARAPEAMPPQTSGAADPLASSRVAVPTVAGAGQPAAALALEGTKGVPRNGGRKQQPV